MYKYKKNLSRLNPQKKYMFIKNLRKQKSQKIYVYQKSQLSKALENTIISKIS